jgi:putative FmdB family regulatory protein
MPLYEYRCRQCGHQFEIIQKFSDPSPDRCERCGGAVEKLLSAPGLQFKGSGWYITDYARKDKETTPKKEAAVAGSTDKTAAPASGSNPADSKGKKESGGSSPPPAPPSTPKS